MGFQEAYFSLSTKKIKNKKKALPEALKNHLFTTAFLKGAVQLLRSISHRKLPKIPLDISLSSQYMVIIKLSPQSLYAFKLQTFLPTP